MYKSPILIVDDDTALLQALPQALYLRMQNITVETTDSPEKALNFIEEHDYDAIVSDIKMPGMDGLELLAQVRERRSDTPVLLVTGHGEHDLAIRALRGGAYDYILKPIDRDSFVAALQRAIQTRQLRRKVAEQHLTLLAHNRSLEQTVQFKTHELVEANATKDKLLNIVAHEVEPPLNGLRGMTQLLRRQLGNGASADMLEHGLADMEHAIERTARLVHDLLDTSLMNTNMFMLQREQCDLVEVCHLLLDEYTSGGGPRLTCEFRGSPLPAMVDRERINQVLINLLVHARKSSSKGSPIIVTLQQSGYEAILAVHHAATLILGQDSSHMLDQDASGTDLGLSVVRKIVERHGGQMQLQSDSTGGCTYEVRLPLFIDSDQNAMESAALMPHTQAIWTIM